MKPEKLMDAIGQISDRFVVQAKKSRRVLPWGLATAACAAIVAVGMFTLQPWSRTGTPIAANPNQITIQKVDLSEYAVSLASYPEMIPYPNYDDYVSDKGEEDFEGYYAAYDSWRADVIAQKNQPEGYADGLEGFFSKSIPQFLTDTQGENRVYSPLNVYMALGMLAEVTDGNSRDQILTLLGSDSMEALRAQAKSIWNANYCDDGVTTSVLASSLWLNQEVHFVQDTLNSLSENYYASSFYGDMSSEGFSEALQSWINEQTGGRLEEQASGLHFTPETLIALATTINFKAKWSAEFQKADTSSEVFHAQSGDITWDFMHQSDRKSYFWGDKFSAVSQDLECSGKMWLILPEEGISPEALLSDAQTMEFLLSNKYEWESQKELMVNESIPKFDVASDMDLVPGLRKLGITDVFDYTVSDFSPLTTDTDEIFVSEASHAARVTIDEEGCTAVAYTVMTVCGAGLMEDIQEIDFTLDRPFLFAITGEDDLPLFVGVVNHP